MSSPDATQAERDDMAARLAGIVERTTPCYPPSIADGYSDCCIGVTWPCEQTEVAWLARGLDPLEEVAKVLAAVRTQEDRDHGAGGAGYA